MSSRLHYKVMAEKLKAADVFQKDAIVSNLSLKLHFDQQKMPRYSLKESFAPLVALNEFQSGGADATSFELMMADLAEWFVNNEDASWKIKYVDTRIMTTQEAYSY